MNATVSRPTAGVALLVATVLSTNAAGSTIVYNNSSTTLGAGSIPIFSDGSTTPGSTYQEVGDVVTLDPSTAPDRQLESIRVGYFTQDVPNDGNDDDRFISDFIFRIYAVDGGGDVIDSPVFERTFEDNVWFDGAFSQVFEFEQSIDGTTVLPETFAYTLAVSSRADDPDTAGDGIATNFSFNSRGPVDVGSSPPGLLRRNSGTFETIVFGSGRETRLTINAGPVTIPEPASAAILACGVAVFLPLIRAGRR
ncbi:MAG: hypothetical protein AAGB00_07800 [Planctomycetota bacterium]